MEGKSPSAQLRGLGRLRRLSSGSQPGSPANLTAAESSIVSRVLEMRNSLCVPLNLIQGTLVVLARGSAVKESKTWR